MMLREGRAAEAAKVGVRVLFVCTGNICRSPTAEGVFRHRVAAAGLQSRIQIASAGTHDYHVGGCPDRRAVEAAARRGYDLSAQKARHLRDADFREFDYLLAMDRDHLAIMLRRSPVEHRGKISLFMDHAPHLVHREVPDPYYGGATDFELVLDLIEAACDGLLRHILPRLNEEPGTGS
jgi:protein-tyrosine phosphatase